MQFQGGERVVLRSGATGFGNQWSDVVGVPAGTKAVIRDTNLQVEGVKPGAAVMVELSGDTPMTNGTTAKAGHRFVTTVQAWTLES